jgi:DNA-binding NarL/FixJ family response regulator
MQLVKIKDKLSQTEFEIFNLISKGNLSKEISTKRNCSERTIEKHRSNIIKKLNISQQNLTQWILKNLTH